MTRSVDGVEESEEPPLSFAKRYKTEVAAGTSSVISTLTSFPLDSIKTRLQTYPFPSLWSCVIHTKKTEGMMGFWRGSLAPLLSISMVRTVSFSIYKSSRDAYREMLEQLRGEEIDHRSPGSFPGLLNIALFAAGGATSGAGITVVACPFEFTKLSSQLEFLVKNGGMKIPDISQPLPKGSGTYTAAKRIVDTRGLRGLYSGFHLHLARDTLGTAIYFTLYETFKQTFSSREGATSLTIAGSGGLCGLLSWVMIYPIDSAKSIYQRKILETPPGQPIPKQKHSMFNRRMYRGLGVSMTRSCLLNALFFSSYEYVTSVIEEY